MSPDTDLFELMQAESTSGRLSRLEQRVDTLEANLKEYSEKLDKLNTAINRAMWIILGVGAGGRLLSPDGLEFVKKLFGLG